MKKLLLLTSFLCLFGTLCAQTYDQKAAEIQKMIWGAPAPEFTITEVPVKYANEGAVILAQSYTILRSTSGKFRMSLIFPDISNRVSKLFTLHERVKINDKSALERYSTLEYQKQLNKSKTYLMSTSKNVYETYIGARIIKPNGQEITVNTGEEVLLKNSGTDKVGKLAITGLQVGDILDYYISDNYQKDDPANDNFRYNERIFVLADEYPILNYSLTYQIDRKAAVFYISANGAPAMQETKLDNGDKIYSLKLQDLPKYQSQLWTAIYRQYPYIQISTASSWYAGEGGFDFNKQAYKDYFSERDNPYYPGPELALEKYYGGKKKMLAIPLDSLMRVFYDFVKEYYLIDYDKEYLGYMNRLNYRTMPTKLTTSRVSRMLTHMNITHEVILVAPRDGNSLQNVFTQKDYEALIRITNGNRPLYMCFDDVVTHFNEIPTKFQGEKAIAMTSRRKNARNYEFTEYEITLPVTPADQNTIEETIQVELTGDMQHVKIARQVKQTGYLRHDYQKALLSLIDIYTGLGELIRSPLEPAETTKGASILKYLKESSDFKKIADAYFAEMTRPVAELRQNFMDEAKAQYDQEPVTLSDYKVINNGLEINQPPFEFTSTIVLNNFVKKAGGNYIIEVGKFAGNFLHLEEKDRQRTIDVYMPGARTFKYNISFNIPPGYKVTGVEDLNKQKSNKTGSFTCTAAVVGNLLNITVTRTYSNNFEKAADWPLVAEMVDAAFAFNNQKILLEK